VQSPKAGLGDERLGNLRQAVVGKLKFLREGGESMAKASKTKKGAAGRVSCSQGTKIYHFKGELLLAGRPGWNSFRGKGGGNLAGIDFKRGKQSKVLLGFVGSVHLSISGGASSKGSSARGEK